MLTDAVFLRIKLRPIKRPRGIDYKPEPFGICKLHVCYYSGKAVPSDKVLINRLAGAVIHHDRDITAERARPEAVKKIFQTGAVKQDIFLFLHSGVVYKAAKHHAPYRKLAVRHRFFFVFGKKYLNSPVRFSGP